MLEQHKCTRAALRSATQGVHDRLHRHPFFSSLLKGDIHPAQYRQLLLVLFGFHGPLEEKLVSVPKSITCGLDMTKRRRAARLVEDLTFLGLTPQQIASAPQAQLRSMTSPGAFLGALYVRDGSMQGGSFLATKLDRLFALERRGRSFFIGEDHDRDAWSECCAVIEKLESELYLETEKAALETYRAFENWISGQLSLE